MLHHHQLTLPEQYFKADVSSATLVNGCATFENFVLSSSSIERARDETAVISPYLFAIRRGDDRHDGMTGAAESLTLVDRTRQREALITAFPLLKNAKDIEAGFLEAFWDVVIAAASHS